MLILAHQQHAEMLHRVPILVFDTCLFFAAVYKGIIEFRNGMLGASRLMQILLRDSVIYFIV